MAIKTIEQFRTEATSEINARKTANGGDGMFAQVNKVRREYTDAEYTQAIEDLAQYKLDQQDNNYKRARQESYPELGEQLDLLYHDMAAGKGDNTGEWYKAVKKVKDDNPKPS